MSYPSGSPPHDERAERAVLAGATIWATNVPELVATLTGSDFYLPRHQRWFLAIANLHGRGESTGAVAIIAEAERLGEPDPGALADLLREEGERSITGPTRVVAEYALRRRLLSEASELTRAASDLAIDPSALLEESRASLAAVEAPADTREPDDMSIEDFLQLGVDEPTPWVVPGLMRRGWRTVVVAREGQGKTWLLRQVAVCAAYGLHPLRNRPIEPVRTLLMDMENPDDHLHYSLSRLVGQARRESQVTPEQRLWRRPGGINVRKRADRMEVETLLKRRRPELLVFGPLYKMYRVTARDSWDLVASEVQDIIDDWRYRYDLAVLIEDHAPKGTDLVPFGSSLWLRWPEIGIGLQAGKNESLDLMRWRGDRMPTDWPESLDRGRVWPWEGRWRDAAPDEAPAPNLHVVGEEPF